MTYMTLKKNQNLYKRAKVNQICQKKMTEINNSYFMKKLRNDSIYQEMMIFDESHI